MITVQQLAEIVGRKVSLKRIGRDRWAGLCPFHQEKTPSFQVWQGRRGEGRFTCHGCGANGDAVDWIRKVEGKSYRDAGGLKPDPELRRQREEARQHEQSQHLLRDVYPDLTPEAELFIGNDDDPLTTLKFRLRRRLAR
jgi:CHC2 zinc finger